MRAGEVAARAGINVETLRYYERRGLLPEPPRTPNGHRDYDEDAVRFVRAVKEAQSLGFSLAEVEEYLRVARRGETAASEALRVRMAAKIDEIDGRLAGLRRVRDDLARIVGCACDSLDHCTCGAAYLARRGRGAATRSVLHVTNGESAGNTLRQTSLGGAVLAWQDVLHEGPVPAGPRAHVREARAGFLSDCGWGRRASIAGALERRDEQLVDALALVSESGVDRSSLELIVVGEFPGRPQFRGLGELDPEELESLWPMRERVAEETVAWAAAAWVALREPEPVALALLSARDDGPLPFAPAALRRLLAELPSSRDGLSATERRALEALAAGSSTPAAAFQAAQAAEAAPFLGDAWFFRTLAGLSRGEARLVETGDGEPLPQPPPLGTQAYAGLGIRLTELGRRVLGGEADRVELLGIDRWIGGTHLVPGAVWRWDAAAGRLVQPG